MVYVYIIDKYKIEVSGSFMDQRDFKMACFPDLFRLDIELTDYSEVRQDELFDVIFLYQKKDISLNAKVLKERKTIVEVKADKIKIQPNKYDSFEKTSGNYKLEVNMR